ncbi:diguanylate cyclase [Oscillatoria sp. CS-180]|uniref:diguanylate cyclase domain-containing protein n=1 Tax=Oscillatoria sp. CS-180 TaxID=3021720 RepID=UPI00232E94E9|nr:diguanylate cyclase [Oscillatoria sp. CS-180]MDB9529400.1 diguanylate cyclase [Oscillatoria sp. CS-180]
MGSSSHLSISEKQVLEAPSNIANTDLQFLFDSLPVGIAMHTTDGCLSYLNNAARRLFNYYSSVGSPLDNISSLFNLYVSDTELLYPIEQLPAAKALQGYQVCVTDLETRQGDRSIYLQANAAPIRDEHDTILYVVVTFQEGVTATEAVSGNDYSEHKQQQDIAKNQAILTAIPELIVCINRQGFCVDKLSGNSNIDIFSDDSSAVGHHLSDYLPPDLAATQLEMIYKALDTMQVQVFEQSLIVHDRRQYEEIRVVPCGSDEVLLMIRDISDRKLTELALKQSEADKQAIISALPDLMFRVSNNGYWLDYIQTNAHIDFIADTRELEGKHISEYLPAEIAKPQLNRVQKALSTGEVQVFEQQVIVNDRIQYEEVRIVPRSQAELLFIIRDITDRKVTEIALQHSEAENRAIISAIPDLIFRLHRNGTFLAYFRCSKTQDLIDKTENPIGNNIYKYARNTFYQNLIDKQMQVVHQVLDTQEMMAYEQQVPLDKTLRYEEVRIIPNGKDEVLVIVRDINDRKEAELALQQSETQKQAILTAIPDLIFYVRNDGTILEYLGGRNFLDLFGDAETRVGHNLKDYATTPELAQHIERKMQDIQAVIETGEMRVYEQEIRIKDVLQYEEVYIVPVDSDEVLIIIRDISDRKRMEAKLLLANERLEKLSLTDPLTTLANRRSLDERLTQEWTRSLCEQQPVAFILFDLDFFKRFNDTYGHQKGDDCLFQVARAALEVVDRSSDLVARYGGEEFAIVLPNTSLKEAYRIAQCIQEDIEKLGIPHASSDVHAVVTASVGVSAMIPTQGSLPNVLIRQADQALYVAKQVGRNNCQCFTDRP